MILGRDTGEKFAKLLSLVPEKVLKDAVTKTVDGAVEAVIVNSSMMWSLVPAEDYPELREKYLSDPARENIRKITDEDYEYKKALRSLPEKYPDTEFFTICGYDMPIFPAVGSGRISSDGIVHTRSSSMGAILAAPGETLSDNYAQSRFPERRLISPDRKIDASAGAFPFTTWYVKGMGHMQSASYRRILLAAKLLLTDDSVHTADDTPDLPQFSEY